MKRRWRAVVIAADTGSRQTLDFITFRREQNAVLWCLTMNLKVGLALKGSIDCNIIDPHTDKPNIPIFYGYEHIP